MNEQQNGHGLWPLRLLAVAIALSVWAIASYIPRVQEMIADRVEWSTRVDLSYSYAEGSDLTILNPIQQVEVQVRGTEQQRRDFNPADASLTLSLDSAMQTGPQTVVLRPEMVKLPRDMEALSIEPTTISLLVDREETRLIQIQPEFLGESPRELLSSWVEPADAQVRGPKTMLDRWTSVSTSPVNLDGRFFSFNEVVQIPQPGNQKIRILSPQVATVFVELEEIDPPAPNR